MAEHDKSLARSPHYLTRFDPKARKELVVRGLLALSELRDAGFYFLKGEEQRMRGNLDMAISYYEKALEIDPEHEDSLFARGWCYAFHQQQYGEYKKAIADFSKVIDMNPRHASAYYYRGITLFVGAAGRVEIDRAISDYTKAIELTQRHDSASAYFHRGHAYYVIGEHDKAISDYSMAIELNPRYVRAYTDRGSVYDYSKGDYEKAISDYNKAIEIDPGYIHSYTWRGSFYRRRGEYDKAIADHTKAIELNQRCVSTPAYRYRGVAHYLNHETAIEFLTRASSWLYEDRGNAYRCKREYDKAISDYTKAIEIYPGPGHAAGHAHLGRADAYYWKGQYDKAWEDLHKAQSLGCEASSEFLRVLRKASGRAR